MKELLRRLKAVAARHRAKREAAGYSDTQRLIAEIGLQRVVEQFEEQTAMGAGVGAYEEGMMRAIARASEIAPSPSEVLGALGRVIDAYDSLIDELPSTAVPAAKLIQAERELFQRAKAAA